MTKTVSLADVTKRYGDVEAVKQVSLSLESGEIFGIVGPSGSGKSTLLRLVDVLERPTAGKITVLGKSADPHSREGDSLRRRIGLVLQKPVVLNRSVANNIAYSLRIRGVPEDRVRSKVLAELKKLGLEGRSRKNARTLSGGEMQRLSFSRSTVYGPELLMLDEFAANLDPANVLLLEEQVRDYMKADSNRTTLIVTHNLFQAKRLCDRIALMWDGQIIEVADKRKFFEDPADERTAAFVKGELVY